MRRTLPLLFLSLVCSLLAARQTPLSRWQFSKDGIVWTEVTIPHSCNSLDGRSDSYYRGRTWYRRDLPVPAGTAGRPRFLLFEGAAQAAEVSVGGTVIAVHKGGYTPFVVPLKGVLREGENRIEVACDNAEDLEMIPVSSDFNKNNGLHNPVTLLEFDDIYFSPETFGPYRLHVVPQSVSEERATARVRTTLCNTGPARKVKVTLTLRDGRGKVALKKSLKINVPASGSADVEVPVELARPHLWNGVADPYLYTVELKAGTDRATTEVGFRYYAIDREKGFSLNGKPYPLRGVSMHQDTDGKATALSMEDYDRDYAIVKELGCNFLRLAHYPHNDYAFRLCDRMGIIVQTEVPWVNVCGERATAAYFDNIHQQMYEMVTSLFNHPSIVFWGMWNELDAWGNKEWFQGPLDARRVVDETARLYAYAKSLDPSRYVGLTDDSIFKRPHYTELQADYYSENKYYGWYTTYGDFSGITPTMTWIRDHMGPANLSEYGVGVNPFCHTWKEEDIRRYKDDARHVEEYGNRSHEAHAQQIALMPWLNFTSLWILFDFPVADRLEGYLDSSDGVAYIENDARKYMNDKGLVTRDRQTKKDTFYLYKSWWNHEEETVYIAGRRLAARPAGQTFTLTVYSNARSLTLYRDHVPVRTLDATGESTGVIWKFEDVAMGEGTTSFRVVSDTGLSDTVTFSAL